MIVNLKPGVFKSVNIYANEHNLTQNQVVEKALKQLFEDDYIENSDELYAKVVKIASKYDRITASLLQRRLKIGYARAIRLIQILEAKSKDS